MSQPLQYLTNEQGERVGVLLDWNTYARLANPLGLDEECLMGCKTSINAGSRKYGRDKHPFFYWLR